MSNWLKNKRLIQMVALLQMMVFGAFVPVAQAGMVGVEPVIADQVQGERDRIQSFIQRDEVREQFIAQGVDPVEVDKRIAALSNQEVRLLANQMDSLPAGSDSFLGAAIFIFVVLLFTDILGYTDIFPFVNNTVD